VRIDGRDAKFDARRLSPAAQEDLRRFLAAPREINAVAYEQVESLWPVNGSVLVYHSIAYVAAGRSSYLDGGIVLYGLEPATGRVVCTTRLSSEHPKALAPPPEDERQKLDNRFSQNHTD
jgi:hypothetical protein